MTDIQIDPKHIQVGSKWFVNYGGGAEKVTVVSVLGNRLVWQMDDVNIRRIETFDSFLNERSAMPIGTEDIECTLVKPEKKNWFQRLLS